MKKIFSLLLSAILVINTFAIVSFADITNVEASDYATKLKNKGFPESYIDDLVALHNKYPEWDFEPLITGLDWSTAVAGERSTHSKQLIQKTSSTSKSMYCNCSSCYKNGSYVIQESSNWVSASKTAVEYYMDPRNWLNERNIFQFESTEYNENQTKSGVETILSGTWMYNSPITYKDSSGATKTVSMANYSTFKYSDSILRAARNNGISAYYLASKIRQEVGGSTATAGGASGTNSTYPGIYNYYNIGAYTGATDGLKWASTSSTGYVTNTSCRVRQSPTTSSTSLVTLPASTTVTYKSTTAKQSDGYTWYYISVTYSGKSYTGYIRSDLVDHKTYDSYGRPWTDPDKSIFYGARYISNNFSTQTSGYLQKFNVNPASSTLYSHEYMANVAAASAESVTTYNAYKNANILSTAKTFQIPVFKNMPDSGHDYTTKVLTYATTTEDGVIQKTCKNCGDVIKETVPKASTINQSWETIICVGTVQRPRITVYDRTGKQLTYKTDFDCVWSNINSQNVGKYTVTVVYKGNYSGSYKYTYEITKNPNPVTFTQSRTTIAYTGTVQRPTVTATNSFSNNLTYKTDFTVSYSNWNSTDVGKYTVTAQTIGNNYNTYATTMDYEIVPQTNVTPMLNRTAINYTGTVQRPLVTVTDVYGNQLTYKKDFTVSYSNWNSTNVGKYTVTVNMIGNYSGSKTYTYYINPRGTTVSSVTAKSKGFTVNWNKQTNQTTGYQIQYATKSDFSNAATIYAGPSSSSSKTVTGRAGNTKYYVRIRTYKNIGGNYYYSSWSSAKSVVTSK